MTVRAAWLLPGGPGNPGQTRETTRLAPLGTMAPDGELATRPGVIPGGTPFAATGAGAMALQIGTGRATVQGTTAQGAYPAAVDAPEVVDFADGDALFDRVDTVALRVYDGLFDTSGQTAAVVEVIPGAPADVPTAPALPPACMPLWDVTVPAGASAGVGGIDWARALTDRRRYTVAVGGIIPGGMSSDVGAYDGQFADFGGTLYRWSAADGEWQLYRPPPAPFEESTTGLAMEPAWTVKHFHAHRQGRWAWFRIEARRTGGQVDASSAGNIPDDLVCTFPEAWWPVDQTDFCACDGYGDGGATLYTGGSLYLRTWSSNGALKTDRDVQFSAAYLLAQ